MATAHQHRPRLDGASVANCVADLHAALRPPTYLEVGTGARHMLSLAGGSVAGVGCAVDPPLSLGHRTSLFLHPGPSRVFFSRFDVAQVLGGPVAFAFLEGDRRFDSLLRDFIDVERRAMPHTVVALPHCVPSNQAMAARDVRDAIRRSEPDFPAWWTGDVWKAVLLLEAHRPDLLITTYDATPAGLVIITNLDPKSTFLETEYTRLVQEATTWPSLDQYWRTLELHPTRALAQMQPTAPDVRPGFRERAMMLIADLESLGEDCELGLVQRGLGQEPLSLLRFASLGEPAATRLTRTVDALRRRFAGLGEPGSVRSEPPDAPPARDRMVVETLYNMTYHSIVPADREVTAETMAELSAAEPRRLQFLRRKLLATLGDGDKLFVWKSAVEHTDAEVRELVQVIRELGPGWLLWIGPSDAEHRPGVVEFIESGFLRGYVSRFNVENVAITEWCEVAARAHAIWRKHVPAAS